jgi:hypothetical protein
MCDLRLGLSQRAQNLLSLLPVSRIAREATFSAGAGLAVALITALGLGATVLARGSAPELWPGAVLATHQQLSLVALAVAAFAAGRVVRVRHIALSRHQRANHSPFVC